MNEAAPDGRLAPALIIAGVRLALVATIALAELAETPLKLHAAAYEVVLAVAISWSLVLFAAALAKERETIAPEEAIVDLALLGGLLYATGGPYSEARQAFFAVPVVAAATQRPRVTAYWGVAAVAVLSLAAFLVDINGPPGAGQKTVASDLYLVAIGVVCVLISLLIRDRGAAVLAYAQESRVLSRRLLDAKDDERRELALGLHDGPVQLLAAAQIDIARARSADPETFDWISGSIARAEAGLRRTAFALYSETLEELGLSEAIGEVASDACRRAEMDLQLDLESLPASARDTQLLAIARELISNAVHHSGGSQIGIKLVDDDGDLVLAVADDGHGIEPERPAEAFRDGHLGLVSVQERAVAVGGTLSIRSNPSGTEVTVRVPEGPVG